MKRERILLHQSTELPQLSDVVGPSAERQRRTGMVNGVHDIAAHDAHASHVLAHE